MQMTVPQYGVIKRKLHWIVYGINTAEQDFLRALNGDLKFDRSDASTLIDSLMILSVPNPMGIEVERKDKAAAVVKSLLKKYGYS